MTDDLNSFSAMLRTALGDRLRPAALSFVDMFAEDGVMEFPYALPDGTARVDGRSALKTYLSALGERIAVDRIGSAAVHAMADPDTVVLEFEGFGRGLATGEAYTQRYVAIIRTRDGRIVHYKDYWNPIAVLRATRGSETVAALLGAEPSRG